MENKFILILLFCLMGVGAFAQSSRGLAIPVPAFPPPYVTYKADIGSFKSNALVFVPTLKLQEAPFLSLEKKANPTSETLFYSNMPVLKPQEIEDDMPVFKPEADVQHQLLIKQFKVLPVIAEAGLVPAGE